VSNGFGQKFVANCDSALGIGRRASTIGVVSGPNQELDGELSGTATRTVVGIDLGTTYTSVAVVRDRKVIMLANDQGEKMIPSMVSYLSVDDVVVGTQAKLRAASAPARTVVSPKRLLGRGFEEREVQSFLAQQPYLAYRGPDGHPLLEICQQKWAIPQVCAHLLGAMRVLAENRLGTEVDSAVLAVPVTFDDARLAALQRAAKLAGFNNIDFIDEPTAAAVANRYVPGFGGIIGIYDFGGGTFDFSLVDVSRTSFKVLGTAGDQWLGGDDIDNVLAEAAANQFWRQHKVDLRTQAVEWQQVKFACEIAKRSLATQEQAVIAVPDVLRTATGMVGLELTIDRQIFARAARALISRSIAVCDRAVHSAGLLKGQLSAIYLCGGTSHLAAVREAISSHFGVPLREGIAPDQAVCLGAAIEAAMVAQRRPTSLRAKTVS
jgi:molecular chaperone DnaK